MKLILIRHGHVEGISPPRFRGRQEVPLTEHGLSQVRATAERVAAEWRVDAIYTSPLGRCRETSAALAIATGASVTAAPEFMDFDYGEWSWRELDAVRSEQPEAFERWFSRPDLIRVPGGESLQEMAARAADCLRRIVEAHPKGTIALVGHDSINRVLLLQLLELPLSAYWRLRQDPACVNEIDVADGHIQIGRLNETTHLFHLRDDGG